MFSKPQGILSSTPIRNIVSGYVSLGVGVLGNVSVQPADTIESRIGSTGSGVTHRLYRRHDPPAPIGPPAITRPESVSLAKGGRLMPSTAFGQTGDIYLCEARMGATPVRFHYVPGNRRHGSMKWNILVASMVLGLGLSNQSFGDLLDRMLGSNGCGCEQKDGCAQKCGDPKCDGKDGCAQKDGCGPKCGRSGLFGGCARRAAMGKTAAPKGRLQRSLPERRLRPEGWLRSARWPAERLCPKGRL